MNSLYFPVQIFVRSQKVDLQPYIEKLDKIRTEHDNMLLALLMEDYIGYIDELSQQTNIMDKKFYVVVPYFPQVRRPEGADAEQELLQRVWAAVQQPRNSTSSSTKPTWKRPRPSCATASRRCWRVCMQCGVQGLPLDTQELIELYYDTYNPDTATRQQLKNFNDLTADVITKGEGSGAAATPATGSSSNGLWPKKHTNDSIR